MFCTNCGKDNPEGAAHCTECGAVMNSTTPTTQSATPVATQTTAPTVAKENPLKKYLAPKFIGIGVGILAVIIVGICVLAYNIGRINMKDYMISKEDFIDDEVVTGINGRGVANANDFFDFDKFNELIEFDLDDFSDMDDLSGFLAAMGGMEDLKYPVEVEISKDEELKNGDVIEVTLKIDKDAIKEDFDVKTYGKEEMTFKYTVSGLQEATILDPFQFIDVEFIGDNSDYYTDIIFKEETKKIKNLEFKCDENNIIVNNQDHNVVTTLNYEAIESDGKVSVTCTYDEYALEEELFLIDKSVKEYEVPDLGDYAKKVADIPIEDVKTLQLKALEKVNSEVSAEEKEKYQFDEVYLVMLKDGVEGTYNYTRMFFIYYYETERHFGLASVEDCHLAYCTIDDIIIKDGKVKNINDLHIEFDTNSLSYDTIEEFHTSFLEPAKNSVIEIIEIK